MNMQQGFALAVLTCAVGLLGAVGPVSAAGDTVNIEELEWQADRHRLKLKLRGEWVSDHERRETVRVVDADTVNPLFDTRVRISRDGSWEASATERLRDPVPCRVRIEAGDAVAEAALTPVPDRCEAPRVAAAAGSVTIEQASWSARRNRLSVHARGVWGGEFGERERIQLLDADGQRLFSGRIRLEDDGRWEWQERLRIEGDAPCRIEVVAGDVSGFADVDNAPDCGVTPPPNQAPVAQAGNDIVQVLGSGQTVLPVSLDGSASYDPDGSVVSYTWTGMPDPADEAVPTLMLGVGEYDFTLVVADAAGASSSPDSVHVSVRQASLGEQSINSTSANGTPVDGVPLQPFVNNGDYALLAANDLGMHCADLDYRVFSILPPFNVMHAQVVRRGQGGNMPSLMDDSGIELVYSAIDSPNDPALAQLPGLDVFKGNFWDTDGDGQTLGYRAYAPLYFGLLQPADIAQQDIGLPVPDSMLLRDCLTGYLQGTEGPAGPRAKCNLGQQAMPGIENPYVANEPQLFDRFDRQVNFFNELLGGTGLGGVIADTNWFAADGVPMLPVDDHGRSNSYPLLRVQARSKSDGTILATTDVVVPVASEADCQGCHAPVVDCAATAAATGHDIQCNALGVTRTAFNVMTLDGDDNGQLPPGETPLETLSNVAKVNILRLHDAKHGTDLDASRPVQCATCHYTPALDLAQLGPTDSPATDQTGHITMSRAMHGHHGELLDDAGNRLFPDMPSPLQRTPEQARQIVGETCYQCHPGKRTQCLRGAMAKGGVVCQDCHGDARMVGNDFSEGMGPHGRWPEAANLNKRVPWASEPACQSCHTGDALDSLAGVVDVPVAADGIRLLQAYTIQAGLDAAGQPDGSEVVAFVQADNKRFAENESLYRLSKGHGGLMCEGCHGSTHAVFPNPLPSANDNIASTQLQGHSGTITECVTCHEAGSLGLTLDGPHGMHPVGDSRWNRDHEDMAEHNANACRSCHGRNGEGTVLSRTATARELRCDSSSGTWCSREDEIVQVPAGTKVGCSNCHENKLR